MLPYLNGEYVLRGCLCVVFLSQENNSIKWASRWDYILVSMPHTNIQWFRYEEIIRTMRPSNKDPFVFILFKLTLLCPLCLPSIMNSLVIVLFLSGMVAMILLRTLHKDIARYNQVDQV